MHEDSALSVKITDFGLARDLMEGCHHITPTNDGTRGTQGWIAPEMYAQNLSPEKRKGSGLHICLWLRKGLCKTLQLLPY
ncbi:hypothetical protein WJX82_008035 [Trebouxia sp. C0006]